MEVVVVGVQLPTVPMLLRIYYRYTMLNHKQLWFQTMRCSCLEADHITRTHMAPPPPSTSRPTINLRPCNPPRVSNNSQKKTPFGHTKAEKFQIVDLTPVEPVELHIMTLVSTTIRILLPLFSEFAPLFTFAVSLVDRLGNCMEEVLDIVGSFLAVPLLAS